ncbi:hypothetical protein TTHERM_01364620 (macronuclear) [Tetrahymena thermophila SB210]|uniref:EGF-like domain-containing protein n=1 Tax=Tetrahymena thermophila (strain SB210) TaxID=312017 RepID=Q24BT9_TETTS|nr:hypothetical protein TTHERM_01364620 [Tetrahymena thermophila SB210]EAS05248.2 hypothetical protein TTHERM_01364620 [Tetrahymena thermophila SB210]|eukprot:XP_001025493.2 hypothetical protein TTHERM_01364620 [Tetrahymena thermophila SB210]
MSLSCPQGQFDNDGVCQPCSSCNFCNSLENYNNQRDCFLCLSKPPYSLTQRLDGSCQKNCPPGLTYNVWSLACTNGCDTSQCVCNNSKCDSCLNSSYTIYPDYNTCYLCLNNSTQIGNLCLKCNLNQFVDLPNKKCTNCDKYGPCEKCDQNRCLQCYSSACYNGFDRIQCIIVSFDMFKVGDICFNKQSSCKTYSQKSLKEDKKQIICDECVDPSYVKYDDGSCQSQCSLKHEIFDGVCSPCSNNCLKCPNLNECTQCEKNKFIFNNSSCVSETECKKNPEYYVNTVSKTCEKCQTDNGFFFSGGKCQKCHSSCKQCSGNLYNQCSSCYDGSVLLSDNTCFTCMVNDGYYLDKSNNCNQCHYSCKTCNGGLDSDCLTCKGNFVLDSLSKKCICKINNCITCSSDGSICEKCIEGYAGADCLECNKVTLGKYIENNTCKDCNSSCKTCVGPLATDCIECKREAYKVDPSSKLCQCAINNCQQCNTEGTECLKCIGGYAKKEGQCIFCDEQNGFFIDLNNICQKCHSSCLKCNGPNENNCLQCKNSGFKLDLATSKCICTIENCVQCSEDGQSCQKCIDNYTYVNKVCTLCDLNNGYYLESGICKKCDESCGSCLGPTKYDCKTCVQKDFKYDPKQKLCVIENCKTLSGMNCVDCQDGFVLNKNQCIFCDTSNQKYIQNNSCLQCHESCKTCHGPSERDCDVCQIALFEKDKNNNNICSCAIKNCKSCSSDGSKCLECLDNYVNKNDSCQFCDEQNGYHFNKISNKCNKCHESCKTCYGPSDAECKECIKQFYKPNKNNKYLCQCVLENCEKCNEDGSKCLKCEDKYFIDKGICQYCDINSFNYDKINQKCYKCHSSCLTCNGPTEKDCTKCINSNFIHDPSNSNICKCKIQNCQNCSQDGSQCLQCADNFSPNQQKTQCDYCETKNQFFIEKSTNSCLSCHEDCKTCVGQQKNECTNCMHKGQTLNEKNICSCPQSECLFCQIDTNTQKNKCRCEKCYCKVENCEKCSQQDENTCEKCKDDFILMEKGQKCQQLTQCKVENCLECSLNSENSCERCKQNYQLNKINKCVEIVKEESYQFNSKIQVTNDGYKITLQFQQPLQFKDDNLKNIFSIEITQISSSDYQYEIQKISEQQIKINISLNIACKEETMHLKIKDEKFIQLNHLSKTEDSLLLDNYVKLTEDQKQQQKEIQTASQSITSTVVGTIIPLALLGNFYIVFSMLDITGLIYYLLYLDIRYPFNVTSFCNLFQNFQFAFVPNMLLQFLDPNYTQWAPKKFIENQSDGYFLHGAGQSFTIITIIMSIYFGLKILQLVPIKAFQQYINQKVKGGWEYSGFLDLIWTVYLYVLVSSLLQVFTFEIYDNSSYINYILFVICFIAVFGIPIKFTQILYKSKNTKDDEFLNQRLSSLVAGLKLFNQDENTNEECQNLDNQNQNEDDEFVEDKQNKENKLAEGQTVNNRVEIKVISPKQQSRQQDLSFQQIQNVNMQQITQDLNILQIQDSNMPQSMNLKDQQSQIENCIEQQAVADGFDNQFNQNSAKFIDQPKQISNIFGSQRMSLANLLEKKSTRELMQMKYSKYTNMVLYYRKIIFSCIIVYLHDYTYVQIALLSVLTLSVAIFYLYIMPQVSYFDNLKNGLSELVLIIIIFSASLLKNDPKDQSEEDRIKIGWIFVSCTSLIITVQALDLIFELCRNLLQSILSIFRKKVPKTVPIVEEKKVKKRRPSCKSNQKFALQANNIQLQSNKFISSQFSLKSIDQISKQEEQNPQMFGESPCRTRILDDFESSSPVKSQRKRRTLKLQTQLKQVSIIPINVQSSNLNANIQSYDQEIQLFDQTNNIQPASASRSFIQDITSRQFTKR